MSLIDWLVDGSNIQNGVTQNSEHIQSIAGKIAELVEANKLDDKRFLELLKRFEESSGATQEQIAELKKGLEKLSGDSDKIQELSVQVAEMANSDTMMITGIAVFGGAFAIMAGFIAFCIYQGVKQGREAEKQPELPDQKESQLLIDPNDTSSKEAEDSDMPNTHSDELEVEQQAGPRRASNG